MTEKPKHLAGLKHVALKVKNFEACEHFYVNIIGMKIDWRPDPDNLYLTTGHDNFALHRTHDDFSAEASQHLDHIGFFLSERAAVDEWFQYFKDNQVTIKAPPKDHRDGTRSFYCADPDGNVVQMIYYPR